MPAPSATQSGSAFRGPAAARRRVVDAVWAGSRASQRSRLPVHPRYRPLARGTERLRGPQSGISADKRSALRPTLHHGHAATPSPPLALHVDVFTGLRQRQLPGCRWGWVGPRDSPSSPWPRSTNRATRLRLRLRALRHPADPEIAPGLRLGAIHVPGRIVIPKVAVRLLLPSISRRFPCCLCIDGVLPKPAASPPRAFSCLAFGHLARGSNGPQSCCATFC